MSTTVILAIAVAIGVLMIFIGLARTPSSNTSLNVQQRLAAYGGEKPLTVEEIELQRPFSERVLRPSIERLGSLLSRSTPQKARQDLLNKLELAGRPGNLTPEDFAAVRLVSAAILAAVGFLVGLLLGSVLYLVISAALGAILGFYFPVLWLKQKVDARRNEIQKGLPDALDLLVICVDAGLGFDASLARVTDKYRNALSDLLSKALREVSLGRPRLEALDEMGRNSGVEDLHNFIQAVIQSEQFGTGIGKILRIQADEMRRKRRQRAQEKGAQATLKMMLPMVGCIFPTLWIVLLGPAVLILMQPRQPPGPYSWVRKSSADCLNSRAGTVLMWSRPAMVTRRAVGISSTSSGAPREMSSFSPTTIRSGVLIAASRLGLASGRRPAMHAASACRSFMGRLEANR